MELQERIEFIEKHPSKLIEFRIINGVNRGLVTHTIEPKLDKLDENRLLGVKTYSPAQMEKMHRDEYVIPGDKFKLEQGATIDLSTTKGKVTWEWVKHYIPDIIAVDKFQTSNTVGGCFFYIHIEDVETDANIKKLNVKADALSLVVNSSPDDLRKRAKLLGLNLENAKTDKIREILLERADMAPSEVITVYKDPIMIVKLNLLEAIEKGIVTIDRESGIYFFGTQIIGTNEKTTMQFLADVANKKIYEAIVKSTNKE